MALYDRVVFVFLQLKRTDHGLQEIKECSAGCAWDGCTESGSVAYILKHCENCPKRPRLRRNYSWQSFEGEMEDNLHSGLVKIIKTHSPPSPKAGMTHPFEFTVLHETSGL